MIFTCLIFRMPLNADTKTVVGFVDGFNRAVFGMGIGHQPLGEPVDRLIVQRIYPGLCAVGQFVPPTVFNKCNAVSRAINRVMVFGLYSAVIQLIFLTT